VARLAVAEERLRFARDLHDLLGHSLSLIALKCDLAQQLVPASPQQALAEIQEAGSLTRSALREVREAVAGYRQPSLASELAGAREVLSAAGIDLLVENGIGALPPALDATIVWVIREAITNVVRHSRARHCRICIRQEGAGVTLEVLDDGRGAVPSGDGSSNRSGLAGLSERLAAVGGWCRSGAADSGGFQLTAWLPVVT
jgi:two-component system, NarL family, sensor histidine kinase DesK